MPLIEVKTLINANIKTCFDLARDVDFYRKSLNKPTEIPIEGKVMGMVEKGDYIRWETSHLFLTQHLILKVTKFKSPFVFVDEMVKGGFKTYRHEHIFKDEEGKTLMVDRFYFESAHGIYGKLIDALLFKRHLKNLLIIRNKKLKSKAESM